MVVLNSNKIDKRGIKGAPDWIIEILSDDTRRHDKITKRELYQEAGVREYWIVEPDYHYVEVFILNNGILESVELYSETDTARCSVLPQLAIDMSVIFPEG